MLKVRCRHRIPESPPSVGKSTNSNGCWRTRWWKWIFFKSALQKVEARRRKNDISGDKASTTKSEMPLLGSLSIERMCQLAQVSRAGFHGYLQGRAPIEEDLVIEAENSQYAL
jgi:hypothetical protein